MKRKGQGAMEYLLLIGAAVGIAAFVIVMLFNMVRAQEVEAAKKEIRMICSQQMTESQCTATGTVERQVSTGTVSCDCVWDDETAVDPEKNLCEADESWTIP